MKEIDKYMTRSTCWQVVIDDRDINLTHDGIIASVYNKDDLKGVASDVGQMAERTILAMKDNRVRRLIIQTSWE